MKRLLIDRFLQHVDAQPDAIAVNWGAEQLSYTELESRARDIAGALRHRGAGRGDVVGLSLPPGGDYVAAMLGVTLAGCVWLPLPHGAPTARMRDTIALASPVFVLTTDPAVAGRLSGTEVLQLSDLRGAGEPSADVQPQLADDLQYVMFTSGSTGAPSGVQVSHANTAGLFSGLGAELEFSSRDNWSALHAHVFGFSVWEIWGPLSTGGCLTVVPESQRRDPVSWFPAVLDAGVSVLSLTPSGFRQLLATDGIETHRSRLLAGIRLIVLSGEAVRSQDIEDWYARVGNNGPRLINTYALTETAGRVAWVEYAPDQRVIEGTIGAAVSDAELFILDDDQCCVAPGEEGELYVSGPMVARGYLGDAELTSGHFIEINPGDGRRRRMYRTGDRAVRQAGGDIVFAGRTDDQVKLRGHRVDLGEVAACLRLHPEVQDAAVLFDGSGATPQLRAFVQPLKDAVEDSEVEFWPSLGEYQIYDDLLYDFMSADDVRVQSYQRAFERHAKGRVVLDIGTGKDALLARLAAAAGARRVYAVEVLPDAAEQARALVEELGLSERIVVLQGDMQSVTVPERVDLCTQGIIGNIGSSDGIVPIWNAARSLFGGDVRAVPDRCRTWFAPAALPAGARGQAAFGSLAADYLRRIFASESGPFDVRLCVRNYPRDHLLAEPAVFETLDFGGELNANYRGETEFTVASDGIFDGLLLWTEIRTDEHETVDFLNHQQAWLPVWLPVADEPVAVAAGDGIRVRWWCETTADDVFPNYRVTVEFPDGQRLSHRSPHVSQHAGQTALHRRLLASLDRARPQEWLATQLPDYMQPGSWHFVERLPLNASGKLDRQFLMEQVSQPGVTEPVSAPQESASPLEAGLLTLWGDVLERPHLQLDDDFFDSGGDSILAVRLTTEVQRWLDTTVFLAALFDAPTVRQYAAHIAEAHPAAVRAVAGAGVESAGFAAFVAASPRDAERLPLSFPQQSLWFLHQLYPEHTGGNEQFMVRLTGHPDVARLSRAWREVVRTHEALRTGFLTAEDGTPAQFVSADCLPPEHLPVERFSEGEAELRQCAAHDIRQPFDLARPPLWRVRLLQLSADEWALLVTVHHIVADGLCVQLISDALATAYREGELAPAVSQYPDFARWQRQLPVDEAAIDWWRQTLDGHAGHSGPVPRPAQTTNPREVRLPLDLPAAMIDRLRALGRSHGATLFMVMLCTWRAWLTRCLSAADLLIGTPVTLRTDAGTDAMIGCLVNNIVVRNPVARELPFVQALIAERDAVLAALEHREVPFEKVVEAVEPERIPGRHPLFQLMFLFEDRTAPPVQVDDLAFRPDVPQVDRASYWDLEFSITDRGEGLPLDGFIGVRDDVYDVDSLAWWAEGFVAFLTGVLENPDTTTGDLPMLSAAQRERVLVEWNATAGSVPREQTLDRLFFDQVARTPESDAIRDAEGTLTYDALARLAQRYANGLQREGVSAGQLVGLAVPRGRDAIALQIATARLGAAWLPLDPAYPAARLQMMLDDAGPALVVGRELPGQSVRRVSPEALLDGAGDDTQDVASGLHPEGIAYALYTSGSTGRPKGVLATHTSAVSRCQWMWREYDFREADVFAQRTSLNFVDSVWEIFGALSHGACVDVLPTDIELDPGAMAHWIAERGISHMVFVPELLRAVLDEVQGLDACLRSVITSGESLKSDLVQRFFAVLPEVRLLNTYGTSETWDVSCYEVSPADAAARSVPVGRPVANAQLCILDEGLQPVPPGVVGEVYAGGLGLAREYLGQPELTAAAFVSSPLPEVSAARLYRTGDLGRFRADGTVELQGRLDRQIKLRGLRIETTEIEAAALRLDEVEQCVAVLRQSPGQPDWLALYGVLRAGSNLDERRARQHLADQLPRPMVPAEIIWLDALPLTPSGKIDLLALPDHEPSNVAQSRAPYEPPSSETERQLAAIWADALGVERVGLHDDFFALRGHSLLATRVIARVCRTFGCEVPLQLLFDAPTVAGMARGIDALRWMSEESGAADHEEREVFRL